METRLEMERRRRGLTQTELAARARLSTSDVSKFENRRAVPYPGQAARLGRVLKVPADQLLEMVPCEG